LLTLVFTGVPDGTPLELTHEKLRPEALRTFAAGWEKLLPKLRSHLEAAT